MSAENKPLPEGYVRVRVEAVVPVIHLPEFQNGVRLAGFLANVGGEEQDHGGINWKIEKPQEDGTTVFEPLKK